MKDFRVAQMTVRGRLGRYRPGANCRSWRISQLLRQSLDHLCDGVGACCRFGDSQSVIREASECRAQARYQEIDGTVQLLVSYGVNTRSVRDLVECFTQEVDRVLYPDKRARVNGRILNQVAATIGEHQQMPRQISAVHGGNIFRIQWTQIPCVVPVVEMAVKLFEISNRGEGGFEAIEGVQSTDPSKIARGQRGKQVEADVRRRGPVGDHGLRVFLKVVRRKEAIIRRHAGFKKTPCAP